MKLIVPEQESAALRDELRSWPERVSSVIAEVELERVARRVGGGAIRRARDVVRRVTLVEFDEDVRTRAGGVRGPELRSLDAIHLATALSLEQDLGVLCAYDRRLTDAAVGAGVTVLAPS